MNFLSYLNSQQQQAVMAGVGPVLVLAGPGSGKTRVLTQRVAYLISSMGVKPHNILAVTFTNKAAREMEQRVIQLIGEKTGRLTMGTFHASCARILRIEAAHLPFESNFVIFDADDQLGLVKRTIKDLNLDEKSYRPASLHSAISNAKNELILPDEYTILNYRDEVVQRVYRRYQELLLSSNALDFDDLLLWTVFLLEETPSIREKYARRFEHILVDEFQDTNLAQYSLLRHLSSFHNNIFVVGDTDQSIYRWRGADYRNVLRFEKDYPNAQVILLEQNYRSTQSILDVAMAIIDRNPYRTAKQLFTDRGPGHKVFLHEAYDDHTEASYVVDTIADLVASKQAQTGDFAVMYRTNAQSRLLEEAFLLAGLPYRLVGAQRFYGRREVKDIIAYLRLILNPNDDLSLTRVINVPSRGIGDKTYYSLRSLSQSECQSSGEMLLTLARDTRSNFQDKLSKRSRAVLTQFGSLLDNWIAFMVDSSPLALMDRVLQDIGFQAYIDDGTDEGRDRLENVLELRRLAADYHDQGLEAFLEQVALVSDQDTMEVKTSVPTLLTLHAAKGLEFPIVMIVGLNDGTLPHSRSFEDPEAMMEERRLFYVGITRAEDRLYLVYSQSRRTFGYAEPVMPSRFLSDIPNEFLEGLDPSQFRKRSARADYRPERWEVVIDSTDQKPAVQPRYQPGMRVEHPSWGEGMVLNSRLQDNDEIVDVFFEGVGLKRLAASLARLEIKV